MLLFLLEYFNKLGFHIPSVFGYVSTRMILAAITCLLITIFFGPFFIRKLYKMKIGQTIRTEKECPFLAAVHKKKKNTPTMGGILILFSMSLSLFLWMDLKNIFTWILFFSTVFLGIVGGIDDFLKLRHKNSKGLKARWKFSLQIFFASLVALYLLYPSLTHFIGKVGIKEPFAKEFLSKNIDEKKNVKKTRLLSTKEYICRIYVPFVKKPFLIMQGFWVILAFIFFLLVIVGSSNAVNLTDGLDGLAAGCLVMVAVVFAFFAFLSNHIEIAKYLNILYIEGSGEIGIYLFSLAGAALGFLWYNGYPAQIFMGDTGSIALGGIIGISSILLARELLLAIVGGIFLIETLSVILQVFSFRYRNKKRIFLCAPLHHHFEFKGWAEEKVVLRFWVIGLLLAIIGIASLKFQ